MPRHVLVVIDDLFFVARVRETARHLGVTLEESTLVDAIPCMTRRRPDLAIVDLHGAGDPFALVAAAKATAELEDVEWLGFYSHVDTDTREKALAAGVDHVLPRSAFTRRLAELLQGGL
jgi:CheY-like chemotaxis protein